MEKIKINQMDIPAAVTSLIEYGLDTGLIGREDAVFAANGIFSLLQIDPPGDYTPLQEEVPEDFTGAVRPAGEDACSCEAGKTDLCADQTVTDQKSEEQEERGARLESILGILLDDAVSRGIIEGGITSRDLFDTKIMGVLTPRPSEVVKKFAENYGQSPEKATDYFYGLSKDCDYIRRYRIRKDRKWTAPTRYGELDITINLSKPEKDPKAIAAALTQKQGDKYPRCLLCSQNVGYAGRLDHPARQNIRLIPLSLAGEQWYMQYSPYVYYNEHCIVLSGEHRSMKIERRTFERLLQFLALFPHYTIGSNADLPIVGGSILTHEHYQGGRYTFAMARAPLREKHVFKGFEDIEAGVVDWPMSVIRLDGRDPARLIELADRILAAWRGYSDESAGILAETGGEAHNTITPIARMRTPLQRQTAGGGERGADAVSGKDDPSPACGTAAAFKEESCPGAGDLYELDLVLRNNRTSEEYPLGIFHPHQELHHIKKENIGLIEVMGLAVLPARLLKEMDALADAILEGRDLRKDQGLAPHADWAEEFLDKYPDFQQKRNALTRAGSAESDEDRASLKEELDGIIKKEIGIVFARVLEHCAVFADTSEGREQFRSFLRSCDQL